MCLAQGPQGSDDGEARTRGLSVSSQALYHWAPMMLHHAAPGLSLYCSQDDHHPVEIDKIMTKMKKVNKQYWLDIPAQ